MYYNLEKQKALVIQNVEYNLRKNSAPIADYNWIIDRSKISYICVTLRHSIGKKTVFISAREIYFS